MVSSVNSSAAFSSAMLSGSQCRGSRDTQALQEKMFAKLDANGDGGIDKTELSDFMSFAASSSGTQATDSSELFSKLDADGDGAVSQTELSDGAKALFDQLRTQLMSAAAAKASETTSTSTSETDAVSGSDSVSSATSTTKPDPTELFAKIDANGDGSIDQDELGSFMEANRPPPPPRGEGPGGPDGPGGHRGGGMFSKIESLLDQYRSNSTTDSTAETEATSSLSIAA